MSEALLGNLGVHSSGQQLCRVTVPQVMEADAGDVLHAANKGRELVRQTAGLVRLAISPCAHECFPTLPNTKGQQFPRLLTFEPA
jgi:hypothetical protein